ncbi:MAG TPA: hypothetical protein VIW73_13510 [Candidatus Cybelea sp.]
MAAAKLMQDASAPNPAMLAAQRESLGLVAQEAKLRSVMAVDVARQSEAMVAANRTSLALAKQQLAVQRASGARFISSANRVGSNLLWGGVGIVGGLAYATQKAIDFNQTALETDMALGGYTRSPARREGDIQALKRAAFAGSEATGFFSAQAIMEGLKKAASAGARPLVERLGMGTFTAISPALSRYMDVLGRIKGEGADQAAMEAIQTAHQFGAYTPAAINRILNAQAALALLMPDKMSTAVTTGAYVASTGINLAGIPQEAILALIATADQSGLGRGRAGARLKDYIEAIAVNQSKAREHAKTLLGVRGAIGPSGSLDLMKSFDILIHDRARMGPQAFRNAVRTAFGAQGAVVAAMFGDPSKTSMFEANRRTISQAVGRGDLTTIQNLLKASPGGQEAMMLTRLQNDIIKFGQYGLPIAVKFFDTINPKLKQFSDWVDQHPADAQRFFDGMFKVGEGMLIVGGAFKVIAGFANTVIVIRGIADGFGAVWKVAQKVVSVVGKAGVAGKFAELFEAASRVAGPLGIVAAALGVIYDDIKEFQKFQQHPPDLWDTFREALGPLGTVLPRNSPFHSSTAAPVKMPAHGWKGFGPPTVHQTVHVSVILPRDSDAGYARRIAQIVKNTAGGFHTTPGYSVPLGHYNAALPTA